MSWQPATGTDDGYIYEHLGSYTASLTGTVMYFGNSSTYYYFPHVLFPSVQIPAGARINSAYIRLTPTATTVPSPAITLYGNYVGSCGAISTSNWMQSGWTLTSASASFAPSSWSTGTSYLTVDISDIITEIIGHGSWAAGNVIGIGWDNGYSATALGQFAAYEHATYSQPGLYVAMDNHSTFTSFGFVTSAPGAYTGSAIGTYNYTGWYGNYYRAPGTLGAGLCYVDSIGFFGSAASTTTARIKLYTVTEPTSALATSVPVVAEVSGSDTGDFTVNTGGYIRQYYDYGTPVELNQGQLYFMIMKPTGSINLGSRLTTASYATNWGFYASGGYSGTWPTVANINSSGFISYGYDYHLVYRLQNLAPIMPASGMLF